MIFILSVLHQCDIVERMLQFLCNVSAADSMKDSFWLFTSQCIYSTVLMTLSTSKKIKCFSHPDQMGGTLYLKLESSNQNPESLRNLLKILPVPNRAHFRSPLASAFPCICASQGSDQHGDTIAVVFHVLSSSS